MQCLNFVFYHGYFYYIYLTVHAVLCNMSKINEWLYVLSGSAQYVFICICLHFLYCCSYAFCVVVSFMLKYKWRFDVWCFITCPGPVRHSVLVGIRNEPFVDVLPQWLLLGIIMLTEYFPILSSTGTNKNLPRYLPEISEKEIARQAFVLLPNT
jgi:hypothetical protein